MSLLPKEPPESEVTPEGVWQRRREFLKTAGLFTGTLVGVAGGLYALTRPTVRPMDRYVPDAGADRLAFTAPDGGAGPFDTAEPPTPFRDVTTYNNFYEFGTDKNAPAARAHTLRPRPWTVEVDGLVARPQTLDVDALLTRFPLEQRVYRMRCVEGWSMVIPWLGFPLARLLDLVEPLGSARYVAFTTLLDPEQMPGQEDGILPWPYREGLRLDEARHPLTLLAAGLYGRALPNQNGAPLRLVVPWKYGFKGIKSIVRITLTEARPPTTWNQAAAREYGFYANVNPAVDHPRWSQATERRIGELTPRPTLPFNGYADAVAHLYRGMDLAREY